MIVFDILFACLIIYLLLYCIYQLFFYLKARDVEEYFDLQEKTRSTVIEENKFCILIYATNKNKNLDKLLGVLNNQSYNKENYEVHVAYQVEEKEPNTLREYALGAYIHNIQNSDYFSKDKAINLLLEKLKDENKFDAFIFIGANRMVGERYLENVNKSIHGSGVYIGSKVCVNERDKFSKKIKNSIINAYLKYTDRTKNFARSMFNLPFFIDGDNAIITSDIIEKMGYVGLEDKSSQLEFSLELAVNDVKITYCPYIISAIDIKYLDFSSVSIKDKINLFLHYFPQLIFKNNSFREFILFLLKPNSILVLLAFIVAVFLSIYSFYGISSKLVVALGAFLLANFIISVNVSQMHPNEVFWLLMYPLCLIWQKTKLFINGLTMNSIIDSQYEEENINSATVSAVVNNGKKDFICKIDLVAEDGMKKVVYREGNRFISTNSCLRMYDAITDIIYKLNSKGLTLKVCQNCKNFVLQPDGTLDCLNGKCQISDNEILIWNGCQFFRKNDQNDAMNLD